MKLIAGAILMCVASAAGAVTLVAGGATLPAVGYTGSATFPSALTPITTMAAGSLFGQYIASTSGVSVSYCPTGSGGGKKILAGNDASNFQVNATCGAANPPNTTGFGPATSVVQADFAGSDAPFSLTEYNNYKTGHSGNLPTQLPSIAGAVGIVFKKSGVNTLTLTEDQICGIFSGQITDWSAISSQSGAINIAFRSDNSGTSFSFLNHLSKVCPSVAAHPATSFKTLQGYGTGAASYFSSYASSFGGSGNAGVIAVVAGTASGAPADGSIGYAEVANGVVGGVKMASVTNTSGTTINPLTGFGPTAVTVSVTFDKAIADNPDPTTGRPILVSLPDTGTCVGLVDPESYANPSSGYPIIAITNLLGNEHGNGSNLAAARGLLGSPYNTNATFRNSVTKIGRATTGYAWLNAGLTQAKVDSCLID
ncbi:PstS family phosphate ABC transporter substrate-binding protein [Luteibacter yeojuensis]|nr:substrate-binding domain-containing protein [Luteibacter yeojuensis]